jgi:hypothetical protein
VIPTAWTVTVATETENPDPPAFVLWFRAVDGEPWEIVGRAATYGEAVAMIGIGDRPHG